MTDQERQWSSPSVMALAQGADRVNAIQAKARLTDAEASKLRREVLPCAPHARYAPGSVKIGYEISFTRHFYKPRPLRPLQEIRASILALEREAEGLLAKIVR